LTRPQRRARRGLEARRRERLQGLHSETRIKRGGKLQQEQRREFGIFVMEVAAELLPVAGGEGAASTQCGNCATVWQA
jgi:hypothetical protein